VSDGDSITRGELAAALNALNAEPLRRGAAILSLGDPDTATGEIFAVAQRNREPEYEPGGLYRDPSGRVYLRAASYWLWLDPIGAGRPASDNCVELPVDKLVPEGSQAARLSRESVVSALCDARNFEDDVEQTADRICKLLAASDEDLTPRPEPKITCSACRHTAPSMSEVAWQPDWKQWRCTDPAACHKRQQEAGMENF
jgi:hypothetical protein